MSAIFQKNAKSTLYLPSPPAVSCLKSKFLIVLGEDCENTREDIETTISNVSCSAVSNVF